MYIQKNIPDVRDSTLLLKIVKQKFKKLALNINEIQNNNKSGDNKDNSIIDQISAFMSKDISFGSKKIPDKRKEFFYSELNILLSSGVDIKTSIEIIKEQNTKKKDIELYSSIKNEIINGSSLSEALKKTELFSNYEYYSIKIGEESGKLPDVLTALHTFYDKKIKQKRQLINSFSYPILVLCMALAAVTFMMQFMVPMFVDIFMRFDAELPAITQFIVDVSDVFSRYSGIIFLFIIGIIISIYALKKNPSFLRISTGIILKIPLLGSLIRMVYLQRFFQAMALLISAKTPMLRAIQLVKNMVNFYALKYSLEQIEEGILHGELLHESMKKTGFFDLRIISLIKVAEEVNRLDTIFENLNERYNEELEHKIGVLSNMMEPILIMFVGVLVAVILIAMYLPMFQLSTTIY